MKKSFFILFALVHLFSFVKSQNKVDSALLISKAEIVGIWQFNSRQVGSGLGETFQFFNNGRFIYSYNPIDDTRNIIKLEGIYRLEGKRLFLTIKSRIQRLGGKIEVGGAGTDEYLFVFGNDSTKRIVEMNPKELDPLLLLKNNNTTAGLLSIKVNNRTYFKLSSNPNKFSNK